MSAEHDEKNPITLTRFIMQERQQFTKASGEFAMLLQSVQLACKAISNAVRKIGIAGMYGITAESSENNSGDVQKKLDVFADEVFINCLKFSQQVYILGSEEIEEAVVCNDSAGGYAVVFDPLDGSSNIDANISVGTIFGIYKKKEASDRAPNEKDDLLRPGNELVASGYCLYGSATVFVLTTGLGVNAFMLDPALGEFVLTHPKIQMPKQGKIYSCNEGNYFKYDERTRKLIDSYKRKGKRARYVGSMVADVHRTLFYGGIFMYPADEKNKKGKLRLIYECNPIAHIMEQAGGASFNGQVRTLDVQPTGLHEREPIWCGSEQDVNDAMAYLAGDDSKL